ncbi:hypothetical protein [Scytonema sp. NUACC26]|uniref:hypothetical protein n=1 Tax=Scytonema sp. NUACC26 TaxID=3140176 RepID=UPI0034DC1AAD
MQIQSSPLLVIFDPPGVQSGMPGDTLHLYAVIINQGNQSAAIDVFFDEAFQIFSQSTVSPRQRTALAPQQKSEISFEFQIPIHAQTGTYDYTLIVDAPEHYPQHTPISYRRQIKVLPKEHTVIREHDPTFSVKPTTNPGKPLIFKPGELLQLEVIVNNRSSRVDRFRLTCPDFDDNWFTIRYLTTGLEGGGLLSGGGALELNPSSQGQILLQFHPPKDTLAGNYSPTIRLHSHNSPDLVLLDLVYIQVPEVYHLDIELNTILGKVSRSSGKYEVKLNNRGNTLRELAFNARTQDEEELCTYEFQPHQVRVLPGKNVGVNLIVKPKHWWQRSLFGSRAIRFQLEIQERQEFPLPDKLPSGTLEWKARPLWQLLLVFLLVLGLLGGIAWIVWLILYPEPWKLEKFESSSPNYKEGDTVYLNLEIRNIEQLKNLTLITTGEEINQDVLYDENLKETKSCRIQQKVLNCNNFSTRVSKLGKYTFTLKAINRHNESQIISPIAVEIKQNPVPEVVSFRVDKSEYEKDEKVSLSWQIRHPEQLKQLQIVRKQEDGVAAIAREFDKLDRGIPVEISSFCTKDNQQVTCENIPLTVNQPGTYTLALQPIVVNSINQTNIKALETNKFRINPKSFKIEYFTINNSLEQNIVLQEGQPAILKWKVVGEDINVQISPFGNVEPQGSKQYIANSAFPSQIEIIVTDKFNQSPQRKGFSIKVEPNLSPNSPTPTPNNKTEPSRNQDFSL